ncbi:MAG: Na/Pi cotransporter family protein [Firmicutes bacterium]|nr:Na/Pi cotransporter family protein [Bacillota bacterium]
MLLLSGIAVFLLGMKLMSSGLNKAAGKSIKKVFARIGDNRFVNTAIGTGATVVTNSSTATTIMVIGFVNAGVMTLLQATGIIMGGNIGTTLTAHIAALGNSGSTFPFREIFMGAGLVGLILMFSKKRKLVLIGEVITGLAVIFVGMFLISSSFGEDSPLSTPFSRAFVALSSNPAGPLLLFLLGMIFTAITQSSSVTSGLVVIMVAGTTTAAGVVTAEPILSVNAALFILIGANVGTTLTTIIAAIGVTANAKRAAFIHVVFNVTGALVLLPIVWPLQNYFVRFLNYILPGRYEWQVALFHTFFNVLAAAVLIGFVKPLSVLATKVIKEKTDSQHELKLHYISNLEPADAASCLEKTAALVELTMKETINMASLARENIALSLNSSLTLDETKKPKVINIEQKINFINKGISKHLVDLAKLELNEKDDKLISSLHYVVADIERIGDHAVGIMDETIEMIDNKIKFSDLAIEELTNMHKKVDLMFEKVIILLQTRDKTGLADITALEQDIDDCKYVLGLNHVSRLESGQCSIENGTHYYAIITDLERVADHLLNIAYSVKNSKGAKLEILKRLSQDRVKKRSQKGDVYW